LALGLALARGWPQYAQVVSPASSPPSTPPYGLHWFRRDLRVAGNPALRWSFGQHRGRVLGIFTFNASFLARPDFSVDRFAFFLETLSMLRDELRAAGSDLLVLDEGPARSPAVLPDLQPHAARAALRSRWRLPADVPARA
jgi:deoxyribodipyrimidine photolyase